MKALIPMFAVVFGAPTGFARNYETVLDKAMPLNRCLRAINSYAKGEGYEVQQWQRNDFYLMQNGQKVGNAYYSTGRCYIYLN